MRARPTQGKVNEKETATSHISARRVAPTEPQFLFMAALLSHRLFLLLGSVCHEKKPSLGHDLTGNPERLGSIQSFHVPS
jgi:hypothetical protein